MDDQHLRLIEAILFASPAPVPERILAGRLPEDTDLAALLEALESRYRGRGVNLVRAGGAWAFRTAPDIASLLNVETWVTRKPSRAQVETLSIIAYHQPITRAEIEDIRGVGMSRGILDTLLEAGWIAPKGRRRTPGRPVTWGTTVAFLDHFGLEDLSHLPGIDEMKAAGLLDSGPAIEAFRMQPPPALDESGIDTENPPDGEIEADGD
jgi:segregation and condensation protein B